MARKITGQTSDINDGFVPRGAPGGRPIDLIGVASGMGGADAGCAQAPARLVAAGLEAQLRRLGLDATWDILPSPGRGRDGTRGALAILYARLAERVVKSLRQGRLPCVIGGDHSCAAGTWSGAAMALESSGPLGLVWIDAHMDSHTPGTSPSSRPHGMPLAALLGQGDGALAGLNGSMLQPRHVAVVGVRSFEASEAELLKRLGVRVFRIEEVMQRGLAPVMAEARAIAADGTAGYGVTLDADALDPRELAAVATPASLGLRAEELLREFRRLAADPQLVAFELAEYCPRLDPDGSSERLVCRLLCAALGGAGENSDVVADPVQGDDAGLQAGIQRRRAG